MQAPQKMKVEVWSDIMCPFCYIGKRHYEAALEQFAHKDDIELVWKSFQLDPSTEEDAGDKANVYTYLAERKGLSLAESEKMHEQVAQMAQQAGLDYDFDHTYMTNSFKAHRLIQLAKTKGLGDAAEEALFKAYFTEGKNVSDTETLSSIALSIGLDTGAVALALSEDQYAAAVTKDVLEAQQIGVQGVPFFVFDRKYAISGAQPVPAFTQTLEQAHQEWSSKQQATVLQVQQGPSCDIDGNCD
jgi:protein disulfide-isomerase